MTMTPKQYSRQCFGAWNVMAQHCSKIHCISMRWEPIMNTSCSPANECQQGDVRGKLNLHTQTSWWQLGRLWVKVGFVAEGIWGLFNRTPLWSLAHLCREPRCYCAQLPIHWGAKKKGVFSLSRFFFLTFFFTPECKDPAVPTGAEFQNFSLSLPSPHCPPWKVVKPASP